MNDGRRPAPPSDAELIERCLRKDNAAWDAIVARYRRKVFHIAYKFTGKHDEAEDLTQEIFLKVFKQPRQVQPRRGLLDLAQQRGPQLLHRPLPGEQARARGAGGGPGGLRPGAGLVRSNPHRALEDRDRRSFLRRGSTACPPSCARRWCCATCRG